VTPADLSRAVVDAVRRAVQAGQLTVEVPETVTIERPRSREHGDYATNVALQLARSAGRPPREVAAVLAGRLGEAEGIAAVEVAGPGFLNLRLAEDALGGIARAAVRAGTGYGTSDAAAGQRVNLEFVSSNPTGPVHVGAVRWAAVGDALARLLRASGASVATEYYFNDEGVQIDRFAESLRAAAASEPTPPDGYGGTYIADIAATVVADYPDLMAQPREKQVEIFRREGVELMFAEIRRTLADFGVHFDVYFNERDLHARGDIDRALERLRAGGHVYSRDGAVWLRTTGFGDDKDRVLVKSDGDTTYFARDAAYYLDKRRRGFDRVVIMLGADHHGYVGRYRALAACLGDNPAQTLEILIGQMVRLLRGGEALRMSKRAGTVLTLEDLVEAVGVDAARYALARSSTDSTVDIDLDLWARQSSDNPVWYVQYVAARTAGVRRNAAEVGISYQLDTVGVGLLTSPREVELLGALGEFPRVVAGAAELRAPHRVARYLEESVAPSFHRFYDECRVIPLGDEEPGPRHAARLLLVDATRVVVANGLGLLGVSAPERM